MRGSSCAGAGSRPRCKPAVHRRDKCITLGLFSSNHAHEHRRTHSCLEAQRHENRKTHSHTHCSWWPGLTCSWRVHLQTPDALELFPLEVHLFASLVQTLKKKHKVKRWLSEMMGVCSPWTHPRSHLESDLIWRSALMLKTCAHLVPKRNKMAKICTHSYCGCELARFFLWDQDPNVFSDMKTAFKAV